MTKDTNIGGNEFKDIKDSTIKVEGDVKSEVKAGRDIVGRDNVTNIYYGSDGSPAEDVAVLEPQTVVIPAGPFLMGSDAGADYEAPQHEIVLATYRMGRYPVTHREYAAFILANSNQPLPKFADWSVDDREPSQDRLDYPVTGISWYDARAFCAWLTAHTPDGRSYHLPTEAEWEKAVRGPDGRRYPWGAEWNADLCHHSATDGGPTAVLDPTGKPTYPTGASSYNCYHMLGNVQEWTASPWGPNPAEAAYTYSLENHEPNLSPHKHIFWVHRGRSYRDAQESLTCYNRGCASPYSKVPYRGFRVVLIEEDPED